MVKRTISRIIKISLFLLAVIVSDFSIGHLLEYMYVHSKSGKYYKLNYVVNKSKDEILIFGNSHAECHYIPSIIRDSLQFSCYNAGFRNQGVLYTYAIHQSILRRYSPKLIIFNFDEGMLYSNEAAFKAEEAKLSELLPFCNNEIGIRKEIERRSVFEKYKCFSSIYPFNSSVIYLLKYFLSDSDNFIDGYYPIYEKYDPPIINKTKTHLKSTKKNHINEIITGNLIALFNNYHTHNTQIIAVISPIYDNSEKIDSSILAFFAKHGIPLLDYSIDPHFINNAAYFSDGHHLNDIGARLFSAIVAHDIKLILKL